MHLSFNLEKTILQKCGWSDKQLEFYGTLIYNIMNSQSEIIADIVCTRNEQGIQIEWLYPHQPEHNISLSYLTNSHCIDKINTTCDIDNEKDIYVLLDIIHNSIEHTLGTFFPKQKIVLNSTNKI